MPAFNGRAQTFLRNPITNRPMVAPVTLLCIDKSEALAEKIRAALSRREPAIRDFYDIDHAVRAGVLNPKDTKLLKQVRQKLTIPGNDAVDISERRLSLLRQQVEAQLRPVLREPNFAEFDLDRAFGIVSEIAQSVS